MVPFVISLPFVVLMVRFSRLPSEPSAVTNLTSYKFRLISVTVTFVSLVTFVSVTMISVAVFSDISTVALVALTFAPLTS